LHRIDPGFLYGRKLRDGKRLHGRSAEMGDAQLLLELGREADIRDNDPGI
jgi:hypothetical protein